MWPQLYNVFTTCPRLREIELNEYDGCEFLGKKGSVSIPGIDSPSSLPFLKNVFVVDHKEKRIISSPDTDNTIHRFSF